MKNAIGYIRVSTKQQEGEDRYGVSVQRKAIEQYAEENDYRIVDWKTDTISGASSDRPAMNEILFSGDVCNPPVDAVIVFKNDRLARDTKLYFYYLYVLERKGIKLLAVEETFDEGNEMANVFRALMQFVAEQERKNISLRTKRGRSSKAEGGGYSGGRVPYGYKAVDHKLVVNPPEAEIVKRAFYLMEQEGVSMSGVAEILNEEGYKSRSGGQFYASTIKSMVKNRVFYSGKYKYGNMQAWVDGDHEGILPPVTEKIKLT